ncbi:MAG: hypothetical protein KY466_14450 [Gemmatimonadetes bacterium]|nr:hypothetical protein [Gemmatimonadota bacterium]
MKYILMMHAPHGKTGDYQVKQWPREALEAHMAHMGRMHRELTESGELAGGEGLAPPAEAKVVRAGSNGAPVVTDGPFPESKEFLAGFWLVDVESAERAYEIAAETSAAPGPDGKPMNMAMEVRRVMDASAMEG